MSALTRAISNHAAPADDTPRHLPTTLYVDFAQLEASLSVQEARRLHEQTASTNHRRAKRITTVKDEVVGLRRNVQDAARAVLRWLASVTEHRGRVDLDRVLDKCLRPGSDTTAVNYTALAQEINQTLSTDLSPKRIQTAIRHLRDAAAGDDVEPTRSSASRTLKPNAHFDALRVRLESHHQMLIKDRDGGGHVLRRAVAHDVLGALRSAAGRLIDCGFGEGIPQHVDLDATRQRFLAFVRRAITPERETSLREDIDRLVKALKQHDGSTEADTQLVIAGVCVVADLAGPDSLFGVMARLNLIMVARPMLDSPDFVDPMLDLANRAGELIHDRATQTDMAWVRLQPQDQRTPSPNRVRSYCLNNAATHILQRLHTGKLAGSQWFATAQTCYDTMHKHDRGFKLLKVTEAIMLCVLADMTLSAEPAHDLFKRLGQDASLELLADLARYDNSPALNQLVRRHADAAHPGIVSQLLVLPA